MDDELAWLRQAQSGVAGAPSINAVRQAVQTALNYSTAQGLTLCVGLLTELHQKASQATDADLAAVKSELGQRLKTLAEVLGAGLGALRGLR